MRRQNSKNSNGGFEFGMSIQQTNSDIQETVSQISMKNASSSIVSSKNKRSSKDRMKSQINLGQNLYRLEGNQFVNVDTNRIVFRIKKKTKKDSNKNTNHSSLHRQSSTSEKSSKKFIKLIDQQNTIISNEVLASKAVNSNANN